VNKEQITRLVEFLDKEGLALAGVWKKDEAKAPLSWLFEVVSKETFDVHYRLTEAWPPKAEPMRAAQFDAFAREALGLLKAMANPRIGGNGGSGLCADVPINATGGGG